MTFNSLPELSIAKGRLQAEGIDCYVQDEYTIQAIPIYSGALGGLKLKVREEDVERALNILSEYGYHPDDRIPDEDYSEKIKKDLSFLEKWSLLKILTRLALIVIAVITIIAIVRNLKF